MSKEFKDIFSQDPQRKAAAEAERQRISDSEAAVELAARRERNLQDEKEKYDALVTEVLVGLKVAAYPSATVNPDSRENNKKLHPNVIWRIASEGRAAVGRELNNYIHVWNTVISVGLVLTDDGRATAFRCSYKRETECALTREALVEALITLHKPEPAYPRINSIRIMIQEALERVSTSKYLKKSSPWSSLNVNGVYRTRDFSVPELGPLPSRERDGEIFGGVLNERIRGADGDFDSDLITVKVIVDEKYIPTHYRCTTGGETIDVPVNTDLVQFLENMLKQHVALQEQAAKETARSKSFLGKLSNVIKKTSK